jgi:hypothetical protein
MPFSLRRYLLFKYIKPYVYFGVNYLLKPKYVTTNLSSKQLFFLGGHMPKRRANYEGAIYPDRTGWRAMLTLENGAHISNGPVGDFLARTLEGSSLA